jgi:hypothetical protein
VSEFRHGAGRAAHLPARVLPVTSDPPQDLALILDDEYSQIASLLRPGRRSRPEARARIRTLLAMEAHVEPDARVSSKDVDRVEQGIRSGGVRDQVFPRLKDIATSVDGAGVTVKMHFTKTHGAPIRYVADLSVPAAAVREVDLQRKYHRSAADLASAVGLTGPRSLALRLISVLTAMSPTTTISYSALSVIAAILTMHIRLFGNR